ARGTQSVLVPRVGVTGGPPACPVEVSTPLLKMFEGACSRTDCSPEQTTPSPAPTPAKNRDLGTFETHAESEPQGWSELHDWAETFAAPPLTTAQAMTNSKPTLLSTKHFITPLSAADSVECPYPSDAWARALLIMCHKRATIALRSSAACWLPSSRRPEGT